jgi:hypothetical protein
MRAYAGSAPVRCCSPQLPVSHLSSPSIADKVALLTFPNRNGCRAGGDSSQTTSCCWLPNKEHTELGMVRRGQWQKSTKFTHYPRGLSKSSTPKLSLCCLELRSHMSWAILPNYVELDLSATCTEASESIAGPLAVLSNILRKSSTFFSHCNASILKLLGILEMHAMARGTRRTGRLFK